ncbi:MAG: hypothetical protein OEV35_05510 [Gallionellaceae bacterium]|nr:hypothetical protein [Gallionellaceae bacterium]
MPNHSAGVVVISSDELEGNGEINKPGVFFSWGDYEHHYLAEGDSWFSLSDILSPSFLYRFGRYVPLNKSTLIVNCAYPGDTLANMVDWSKNFNFPKLLRERNFGWEWDGILLSAGGNDIINAALSPVGILKSCANPAGPSDFVDSAALTIFENHLRDYFGYFIRVRDTSEISANRNIPIYYHTYGYPTPRNVPASLGVGPWLYAAFTQKNIPQQYWQRLSDLLMDELARIIRSFGNLGANLNLVDTLANVSLERAAAGSTSSSGDWLNEIHLNNSGKDKVARYWGTFL